MILQSAKDLKSYTTQLRRTEAGLRRAAVRLDLSRDDKQALLKAAGVLAAASSKVSTQARQAKQDEEARAKALAQAEKEAQPLIAQWPMASTLDKIALCLTGGLEGHLRRDLSEGTRDFAWSLNYWTDQAVRDITSQIAWSAANRRGVVSEIVAEAQERLGKIRARDTTILLAHRWQEAMDAKSKAAGGGRTN